MVQALRSCSNSQCGTCLYRGNGIACKKKLLAAATDELDTGFSRADTLATWGILQAFIHFQELDTYKRKYSVEELKRLLGGEGYKEYRDFKRRVLKPAVEEINKYSDKTVTFQEFKQRRWVVSIEFTVASKTGLEAARIRSEVEKEMGMEQLTLWDELEGKGLV